VLLVHPGGPFWAKRDDGAWSIPKGEYEDGEDPQAAARREFEEELGSALPTTRSCARSARSSRRTARSWRAGRPRATSTRRGALEHVRDGVAAALGPRQAFPEIDRAEWFPLARAREKLVPAQAAFVDRLEAES
jgi:predicted NUDIX family NTP pyrophosphohydrolase